LSSLKNLIVVLASGIYLGTSSRFQAYSTTESDVTRVQLRTLSSAIVSGNWFVARHHVLRLSTSSSERRQTDKTGAHPPPADCVRAAHLWTTVRKEALENSALDSDEQNSGNPDKRQDRAKFRREPTAVVIG